MAYTNADGVYVKDSEYYRDRKNFVNVTTGLNTMGATKQFELDVDLVKIAATPGAFLGGACHFPKYASVKNAYLVMTEAAAGGTSIIVGTYSKDGTAVDDDSLITATEGVLANMNAIGKRIYGAGVLVATTAGTASTGANELYIGIDPTGTFTAGKGRLIVEFVDTVAPGT